MYFRIGDYTSQTKQDPLFFDISSKRKDINEIVPKLVSGVIIRLNNVAVSRKYNGSLYANDKRGLVDIKYHSPDMLDPDDARFCYFLLETKTPLCVRSIFFI